MVTSQKQIDANRANAQKSTGPASDAGKSASAQNARKHGILAKKVIAAHEKIEEFHALLEELTEEFWPQSAIEDHLVEQLAILIWRNKRLAIAERLAMEAKIVDHKNPGYIVYSAGDAFRRSQGILDISESLKFGRYQVMITNEIRRTLRMLHDEQAFRQKTIELEADVAKRALSK